MNRGAQLTFVGVGFIEGHITLEALNALRRATKIFYYCEYSGTWLKKLFPDAVDIFSVTEKDNADRRYRYENTVEFLLSQARQGHIVAAAFYGSAAHYACISHMAVKRAREQGLTAQILPGISCFESLTCDLAGHPTAAKAVNCKGITVVTATEYLSNPGWYSPLVPLVLLAASAINHSGNAENLAGLKNLAATLARTYENPYHEVVLYSAQEMPLIRSLPVCRLPEIEMPPGLWTRVTLLIPPAESHAGIQRRAFVAGMRYASRRIEQQRRQPYGQQKLLSGNEPAAS
jgi:hypothetical protein